MRHWVAALIVYPDKMTSTMLKTEKIVQSQGFKWASQPRLFREALVLPFVMCVPYFTYDPPEICVSTFSPMMLT